MLISVAEMAVAVWLSISLLYFVLLRRAAYSLLDPIVLAGIFIPFAGSFLAVLCGTGLVGWDKFFLFVIVLAGYVVGGRLAVVFFGRTDLRGKLKNVLVEISRREIDLLFLVASAATLVLGILGIEMGAVGDARQDFARLFRPLVVLQNGLFFLAILGLLSPTLSRRTALCRLTILLVLSIPFSGKGVLLPGLYWYGLRRFLDEESITLRAAFMLSAVVVGSVVIMAIMAYGAHSVSSAFVLFTQRLWLSGDTYIYAYQMEGLADIRGNYPVTFWGYMLHPLTAIVGIRGYEKPLGAMLRSAVSGQDVLTGPNPHLPVLLDYFFPGALATSFFVAAGIGVCVFTLRSVGVAAAVGRGRFLNLGAVALAIFSPALGFIDTSQVLMTMVAIFAGAILLTALELVSAKRSAATIA